MHMQFLKLESCIKLGKKLSRYKDQPRSPMTAEPTRSADVTDAEQSAPCVLTKQPQQTSSRMPRTSNGTPIISGPVPGTFEDCIKSGSLKRKLEAAKKPPIDPSTDASTSTRQLYEMPLSCHPPRQQSWLELQHIEADSILPMETPNTQLDLPVYTHVSLKADEISERLPTSSNKDEEKVPASSVTYDIQDKFHNTATDLTGSSNPPQRADNKTPLTQSQSIQPLSVRRGIRPLTPLRESMQAPPPRIYHSERRYNRCRNQAYDERPSNAVIPQTFRQSSLVRLADSKVQAGILFELGTEINRTIDLYAPKTSSRSRSPRRRQRRAEDRKNRYGPSR